MISLLKEISNNEFNKEVNVRFNNILNGFDEYPNITLDFKELGYSEDKIISIVEEIYDKNNGECYVDFYISKLSDEGKANFLDMISNDDREFFESIIKDRNDDCYFKILSKELIAKFMRLNTREIFFVTFYFTTKPITIWGNYDLKFPCFFDTNETMEFYKEEVFN